MIQDGLYYRLSTTKEDWVAWMMVSDDKEEAFVSAVNQKVRANGPGRIIKLKGLDKKKDYRVNGGEVYNGRVLMEAGLLMPVPHNEYEAVTYHLEMVK